MDRSNMRREESGISGKINVFISYAPEDYPLLQELEKQLEALVRAGRIFVYHRRHINPGLEWESEIAIRLNSSQLILLLVSPDFISSHDCHVEMMRAMERHSRGEARVIPVILRHIDWREEPFSDLEALPTGAEPVTTWPRADEAFFEVERGIRKVVQELTGAPFGESALPTSDPDTINGDTTFDKQESASIPPGTPLLRYKGHSGPILSLAWSPRKTCIASGSQDGTVQLWNSDNGEQICSFAVHDHVPGLAWSSDGKRLLSLSQNGMVRVWEPDQRELCFTFTASGPIVWSPDGKRIAFATRTGTVQVKSADGSDQPFVHKGHSTLLDPLGPVISLAWSPDSTRIASAYKDGTIHLWNADGSGEPVTYKGHFNFFASYPLGSLMWSPDGKRIASAFIRKEVQVWNVNGSRHSFSYKGHSDCIRMVAWSPDGKRIVSLSKDNIAQVWNPDNVERLLTFNTSGPILWSPDGKRIAYLARNGMVDVWNPDQREQCFTFAASGPMSWSPDGQRIASSASNLTVQVWSAS